MDGLGTANWHETNPGLILKGVRVDYCSVERKKEERKGEMRPSKHRVKDKELKK